MKALNYSVLPDTRRRDRASRVSGRRRIQAREATALTAQSRMAASSPFRFGAIYMPNGVFPDTWHPDAVGSNFQFKPVMQPLEPFRDQLVAVSKMKAPWGHR